MLHRDLFPGTRRSPCGPAAGAGSRLLRMIDPLGVRATRTHLILSHRISRSLRQDYSQSGCARCLHQDVLVWSVPQVCHAWSGQTDQCIGLTALRSQGRLLYYTILYYTILYYTILYYTILYYTILYYTILYYAMLDYARLD